VRSSWGTGFDEYIDRNVVATQRLLEAARSAQLDRFVYASSSSIYGNAESHPTRETALPQPLSPYGVTKLAAEHLCSAYGKGYGVPTISLRYFTVYGPRQRPDMAIHRLIEAALRGREYTLFGDGSKVRDFTYVDDVVEANVLAATADTVPGSVFNVAGGSEVSIRSLIELVEQTTGFKIPLVRAPDAPGDAERTGGSTNLIREALGWYPKTSLADGVQRQTEWHRTSVAIANA
jgi:nucleoside-diphosphate-sugar epimerase